ncbi:MAG: acetylglutamate kinase [Candidatus Thermoplasmatota archaeon]|nr:acetylglutamate kinase [Candidatus Sysuiplasma jiujiangense]MBX8642363.1 acetylglutamate kinase [Candidatus Sysuiplasma jiujiangense]MCL4316880.1 acetylglutamate kinase [Candidatus Thermoplasmatota archaeon]MCL5253287.1 acetylglutamate kinase [Candidatus Thermoplasmatota archaeon]
MTMSGSTLHTQHETSLLTVIKAGGSILQGGDGAAALAEVVETAKKGGHDVILVNGGGTEIDRLCSRLSVDTRKYRGLRITTGEVLDIVQMALSKKSNEIAITLLAHGINAVPLPAFASSIVKCRKKPDPEGVDLGFVGEVENVDTTLLLSLVRGGAVPVIYPVAADSSSNLYNINADELASEVASAVGAGSLVLATDVGGVIVDSVVQNVINAGSINLLESSGKLQGGMIPKLKAARNALNSGVRKVAIVDGRNPANLINFYREGVIIGTEIQS